MPLFNKKRRVQYLGFDDFWYCTLGILALSVITNYLFNTSFEQKSWELALISWSVALVFTICDWLSIRSILIYLRIKFPDFKDDKKRIGILLLGIVGTIVLVDFLVGWLASSLINLLTDYNASHITRLKELLPITIITVMVMAIYEVIYSYARLKKSIREEEQTKQVMIQAQLDTLRNQAQPHFLFNSLNTLRDIIDQDTKEDAKDFVDNLAGVYRFIIESGNTNLIRLGEELKFAKAYIHVQSERFGENLQLHWNIPKEQHTAMIVPMSIQLLLENAIKHNVVSKTKPLIITVAGEGDTVVVRNRIQPKSTQTPSTKIGLKNIEKRYQLISNKMPMIHTDDGHFTVTLPLLKKAEQNATHENSNR